MTRDADTYKTEQYTLLKNRLAERGWEVEIQTFTVGVRGRTIQTYDTPT